jgi:hypothetical protein
MKFRLPLILFAALFTMTAFSSCTKEFICQCTIEYSGQPGLPDPVVKEYPITDKKKDAEAACEGNSGTYRSGEIETKETCELF